MSWMGMLKVYAIISGAVIVEIVIVIAALWIASKWF